MTIAHAGAARCRIRLEEQTAAVRLIVEDDGRGGAAPEGAGLAGMRERVEAVGGTLRRQTSVGTRLEIVLPLVPGIAELQFGVFDAPTQVAELELGDPRADASRKLFVPAGTSSVARDFNPSPCGTGITELGLGAPNREKLP